MKELFIEKNFSPANLQTIRTINNILNEYQADGYTLTLRQLYYQLVARGYIENSLQSYKRIGGIVSDGRLAGLIDWDMIEDRGRETIKPPHWNSPAEIIATAARQFAIDKWRDQRVHIEVVVEKQALEGILIPACRVLDVNFTANKGYSSSSAMYEMGKRIAEYAAYKNVYILYLGDHDPSGIDMTRDVRERAELFSGESIEVDRLALNRDQVEELNPPENPAKLTDSRANVYIAKFGLSSWELDAIEPRTLAGLVTSAVEDLRDDELWEAAVAEEQGMRADLLKFAQSYRNGTH